MTNSRLAIVFPGQGSQTVGMLSDIAMQYPEVQQTFAEASEALAYDLWQMVQAGPASELDKTLHTQPALLTASYAIWRILQSQQTTMPAMLAGHSLGEYTALVCAGALPFATAVKLVAARGQFMQEAVAPGVGAMAAIIGLDDADVLAICEQAKEGEVLTPANFNSVGQIVVAGHKAAVDRAILLAKEKGAKMAILLPVSVPSHCPLMAPAAERLAALLQTMTFTTPSIPVINNVDVAAYKSDIREGLVKQLVSPVRWVDTIHAFQKAGITQILECGPGKVLTGLNKRIDKQLQLATTHDATSLAAWLAQESGSKAHA